jgi:hypothetical protein
MVCNFHLYHKRNEVYEGSLVTAWPGTCWDLWDYYYVYEFFVRPSYSQRPLRKTGLVIRMAHTCVCCCMHGAVWQPVTSFGVPENKDILHIVLWLSVTKAVVLFSICLYPEYRKSNMNVRVSVSNLEYFTFLAPCRVHLQEDETSGSKYVNQIVNWSISLEKMHFVGLYCIIIPA